MDYRVPNRRQLTSRLLLPHEPRKDVPVGTKYVVIIRGHVWGFSNLSRSPYFLSRYDLKLMLFIGVDSENKSIVFAQGFFSDEQPTSFLWALKHYCNICGGHPEVSKVCSSRNGLLTICRLFVLQNRSRSLGDAIGMPWNSSPTMSWCHVVICVFGGIAMMGSLDGNICIVLLRHGGCSVVVFGCSCRRQS